MEHEDSLRERHFVLDLMNFVYAISGKPLLFCIQKIFDEYSKGREGYFSENIMKALMTHLIDYKISKQQILEQPSRVYQDKIEKLLVSYDSNEFLKFLASYSLYSFTEYYNKKIADSPAKLFSSIVWLLQERRKREQYDSDFWERLEATAEEVVAIHLDKFKTEIHSIEDVENRDPTLGDFSKEWFVLELMSAISITNCPSLPDFLKRKLDRMSSLSVLNPNFETALQKAIAILVNNTRVGVSDEELCDRIITFKNLNSSDFLEYCVCYTRKSLLDFDINSEESPLRAVYFRVVRTLEIARKEAKLNSGDLLKGAFEIINKDKERKEELSSITSTELYLSISTEMNEQSGNQDGLIITCKETGERAFSKESSLTLDSMSFSSARSQLSTDFSFKEKVLLVTDNVSSEENVLPATSTVISFEEHVQSPTFIAVSSEKNSKPDPDKICLCEPAGNKGVRSCRNLQSLRDYITTFNETAVTRNTALTSSGIALSARNSEPTLTQASEITPLIDPGEHKNSRWSCRDCCSTS